MHRDFLTLCMLSLCRQRQTRAASLCRKGLLFVWQGRMHALTPGSISVCLPALVG